MASLKELYRLQSTLTGEQVKSLYEGEFDTNAYTDAEKIKVANTETTTELNVRDAANRDRTNHTGAQPAGTISDFDVEVSNNTDVAANTAARHSAVTVADSDTIEFDLNEQELTGSVKHESITTSELSTGVNASLTKADNAVQLTGNQNIDGVKSFIGSRIILPNNSRINGVEHFYQSTKPTARGDSSALVAGDRWYKTNDGTEWWWNGTYWLSSEKLFKQTNLTIYTSSSANWITDNFIALPAYLEKFKVVWSSSVADVDNYYQVTFNISNFNYATAFFSANPLLNTYTMGNTGILEINPIVPVVTNIVNSLTLRTTFTITKVGASPMVFYAGYGVYYRHIAP